METDDEERKSAWKEHDGTVGVWSDGRGGTMWRYEYDDEDDPKEERKNSGIIASKKSMISGIKLAAARRHGATQFFLVFSYAHYFLLFRF